MAVTLAVLCAVLLGVADYLAGVTLRVDGRQQAALTYTALGLAAGIVVAFGAWPLVRPEQVGQSDILWAIAAGFSLGLALPLLMIAMARGPIAIVAPVLGLVSLIVPAFVGPILGDHLARLDVIGLLLALPAAALVASVPGGRRESGVLPAVALATLVGALLGMVAVCFGQTGEASGIAPAIVAEVTASLLLALAAGATGRLVRLRRRAVVPALGVGILTVLSILSSVLAYQRGPVAVVAAVIGMAPGVTVMLAWLVARERIGRWQAIGFGLGTVAVMLFAFG